MRDIARYRFSITAPDAALEDLHQRLARTRWPVAPAGGDWAYGTSLSYMQSLLAYWRDQFDWRAQEAKLNRFTHYRLPTDMGHIHAVIEKGSVSNHLPILLLHGWPGSMIELLPLVSRLAHPEDATQGRDVIALSLPGYAFSDAPDAPLSPRDVGKIIARMMQELLGHQRFVVHGGDWGAAVASWMAYDHPDNVAALHLTTAIIQADSSRCDPPMDESERAYLEMRKNRGPWESGYQFIQGTKPLTLAYALTDSPVGLAAWILEKYQSWSSAKGTDAPPPMDRDDLLSTVMLYWLAGPGPASWMYRFLVDGSAFRLPEGGRIEVPTGLCHFAGDSAPPAPLAWQKRSYHVVHRAEYAGGSHFPGLSCPDILASDILAFLKSQQV